MLSRRFVPSVFLAVLACLPLSAVADESDDDDACIPIIVSNGRVVPATATVAAPGSFAIDRALWDAFGTCPFPMGGIVRVTGNVMAAITPDDAFIPIRLSPTLEALLLNQKDHLGRHVGDLTQEVTLGRIELAPGTIDLRIDHYLQGNSLGDESRVSLKPNTAVHDEFVAALNAFLR